MELSSRLYAGWKPEQEVWAGAAVLGAGWGGRLQDGTAMGAAVDNQKTSSSRHQRSLCHTGPLLSGKPGGDAVSCWRPSWQNPEPVESAPQLEAFECVRREALSFFNNPGEISVPGSQAGSRGQGRPVSLPTSLAGLV